MNTHIRFLAVVSALVAAVIFAPRVSAAEETWVRVMSEDQKASILFPTQPDKIETITRKSPCGTVETHVARHEREGAMLTINGTTLPRAALRFASTKKILRNAVDGVLAKYYGKKVSEKRTKIDGEPGVILEYRVPDYDKEDHPGYRGIAIAFIVEGRLYVVNSILTRENPKARATQEKLLGSIQVHK